MIVIRKRFDKTSFLQRYVPRGSKSRWSQINRDNVARLVAAGSMTPHGAPGRSREGRWSVGCGTCADLRDDGGDAPR